MQPTSVNYNVTITEPVPLQIFGSLKEDSRKSPALSSLWLSFMNHRRTWTPDLNCCFKSSEWDKKTKTSCFAFPFFSSQTKYQQEVVKCYTWGMIFFPFRRLQWLSLHSYLWHPSLSWFRIVHQLPQPHSVITFLTTKLRLNHNVILCSASVTVTSCSVLTQSSGSEETEQYNTLSAEEGGYVNMWSHTCNNTLSTFYIHCRTPVSHSLTESAFYLLA